MDLVNKKFYDGMRIQKEEQLTLQTGKPNSGDGYIDPTTKQVCNFHSQKNVLPTFKYFSVLTQLRFSHFQCMYVFVRMCAYGLLIVHTELIVKSLTKKRSRDAS